MKISIITVTYNSAATIRDTLESVGQQDFLDIEHIIVDGRSTDNTLSIINQFPYISKILSEKDGGMYDAMNKGIALATGDIIGILNSDDVYNNNRVIS
ncbi:MAG: glycosyltransferase, partial [Chitinophagaceae bacterium]|nr:glycosyltransferase [Chitinophagaceae bacterium]